MPLYQFRCKKCDKVFEIFLRPSEANQPVVCPYCKNTGAEKFLEKGQAPLASGVCGGQKET